jgi:hypothetical protein
VNVEHFYHVCRSAATIANVREVTVFGASAIVPWIARDRPSAPFWHSRELDIDPGGDKLATLVDGSIGEGSYFAETFGVYAHGVTLEVFTAPSDWSSRAETFIEPVAEVRIRTPHPLDLTVSKLTRGDPKDWAFAVYCRDHFGLTRDRIAAGLEAVARERPEVAAGARLAGAALPSRL